MSREKQAREIRNAILKLVRSDSSLSANELRIILALERIVARLSADSNLDKHLIFKGGFVLYKTFGSTRFTRDLDALGYKIEKDQIEELVPMALALDLSDGFWFGDVRVDSLDEQGEYGALRFDCAYQIGDPPDKKKAFKKLSRIHFDIGFGDAIPADLEFSEMSPLLPYQSHTSWRVYPPEFIFSEKLQTLVDRQVVNSRGKDVHDMAILFDQCDSKKLASAIQKTFKRRNTPIPISFLTFAENLDTKLLEKSWNSVKLIDQTSSFAAFWKVLLSHLEKIDDLM